MYPFLPSGERFHYLVDFPLGRIVVRDKKKKGLSTIELDVRNIDAFLMTCRSMYYARHAPEVANVLGALRAPDFNMEIVIVPATKHVGVVVTIQCV